MSSPPFRRLLFFGSDDVSAGCLRRLVLAFSSLSPSIHIECVCPPIPLTSLPPNVASPRQRSVSSTLLPLSMRTTAESMGVRVHTVPHPHSLEDWKVPLCSDGHEFDIGVVVSFRYFLTPQVIDAFRLGMCNVHPSLLPQYRGAAPMHHTLLNGDRETGVSIISLHKEKWDAGRILDRIVVPIDGEITYPQLRGHLTDVGAELLVHTLLNWSDRWENASEQIGKPSRAPKIRPDMGCIEFVRGWTCSKVWNTYRAFYGQRGFQVRFRIASLPESEKSIPVIVHEMIRVPLLDAHMPLVSWSQSSRPGDMVYVRGNGDFEDSFVVRCDDLPNFNDKRDGGSPFLPLVMITQVQQPGKRVQSARELANGLRLRPWTLLSAVQQTQDDSPDH